MLVLTENATTMIRALLDRPDYPDTAGIRITQPHEDQVDLAIEPAAEPGPQDQVIDEEGARVFVGPRAAVVLDSMTLDATLETDGRVRFNVAPQPAL